MKSPLVDNLIQLALAEDEVAHDITALLTVDKALKGRGRIIAKQDGVVCGLPIIMRIFSTAKISAKVKFFVKEGEAVKKGKILVEINANVIDLLACERTILNFLQRLSGVATYTNSIVSRFPGIKILNTRKTTPGLRFLEKYATKVGGASNHRFSLADMILIKNNHIDASKKPLRELLSSVKDAKPKNMKWEVEVRNIDEFKTSLEFSPDVIMLDNMSNRQIAQCLRILNEQKKKIMLEISGGITAKRLEQLSGIGVVCVSMGSLTTKATNIDMSMSIVAI